MNRIRRFGNQYEVLITPEIKVSPDSSLMIGNWSDPNLRGYRVVTFDTMNDAMSEAFKYPDIDWYRIVINHDQIFLQLRNIITGVLNDAVVNKLQVRGTLMNEVQFKNTMMDRVKIHGERFNLREFFSDLINFTIVSPYTYVLQKAANILEHHKGHLYLDMLRIREKVINGGVIYLFGLTSIGTVYQIKFVTSILDQADMDSGSYNKLLSLQGIIDKSVGF